MTTKRRQQWLGAAGSVLFGCVFALAFALALGLPVRAATTERVVSDRYTGLAISGFDPVAYFTDAVPRMGVAAYELSFAGATWRFRNEGNMAAFTADPDVYSPQYGGYDPLSVARGVATAGHPQVWLVHEKRLYLFQSVETRAQFSADPDTVRAAAEEKWPAVLHSLVP